MKKQFLEKNIEMTSILEFFPEYKNNDNLWKVISNAQTLIIN